MPILPPKLEEVVWLDLESYPHAGSDAVWDWIQAHEVGNMTQSQQVYLGMGESWFFVRLSCQGQEDFLSAFPKGLEMVLRSKVTQEILDERCDPSAWVTL